MQYLAVRPPISISPLMFPGLYSNSCIPIMKKTICTYHLKIFLSFHLFIYFINFFWPHSNFMSSDMYGLMVEYYCSHLFNVSIKNACLLRLQQHFDNPQFTCIQWSMSKHVWILNVTPNNKRLRASSPEGRSSTAANISLAF